MRAVCRVPGRVCIPMQFVDDDVYAHGHVHVLCLRAGFVCVCVCVSVGPGGVLNELYNEERETNAARPPVSQLRGSDGLRAGLGGRCVRG